jgi:hypothetical protein
MTKHSTAEAVSPHRDFLSAKSQLPSGGGFAPLWMPEFLYPFQAHLLEWALLRGRAALWADCGLGKGPIALSWAENVVRHTNGRVLVMAPLAVSAQMVREGEKFGIEVIQSRDGKFPASARIITTNYELLHHFDPSDFVGAVGDESGILKHFDSVRKAQVTEFLRTLPYRLLCTATAAPNDYIEMGTHSEALGEMGYMDVLSRFFKNDQNSNHPNRHWAGGAWRFRGHAEQEFWRWVCSWARAIRKPSDLGFSDDEFTLPPLNQEEHLVPARFPPPGRLFDTLALTNSEQLEERKRTVPERCERAASLLTGSSEPGIAWCHLNSEGDLLEKLIPGSVQVAGSDPDEKKEEAILAFIRGDVRVLVSKPSIFGWGLNLQHCAHLTFFPSHSFEAQYQAVRRCWRFGQTRPVQVDLVTSEGAGRVLDNLNRKARQADVMFDRLVEHMNDALHFQKTDPFRTPAKLPDWI